MSGEKRCKNKSCNAPLLPGFETEHGLCTRCMNAADKKDRMKAAANIISNIETAKIKTPSAVKHIAKSVDTQQDSTTAIKTPAPQAQPMSTSIAPSVDIQRKGDLAIKLHVGTRISTRLFNKMERRLLKTNTTQSQFLRSLIEDSLAKDQ